MSRMFLKTRATEILHVQQISLISQMLVQNLVQSSPFAYGVVLEVMSLFHNGIGNLPSVASTENCKPDLNKIGQEIYDLWNVPPKKRQAWKHRLVTVEIKPDHLYSPQEVAAVLSVSYDTAARIMSRLKRVANLAQPRAKKRLLRIKGSDLRAYIQDELER